MSERLVKTSRSILLLVDLLLRIDQERALGGSQVGDIIASLHTVRALQ